MADMQAHEKEKHQRQELTVRGNDFLSMVMAKGVKAMAKAAK